MYRHRNLDIALAAVIAILGGLAAAKHLPGQIRIPLGIGLFFAPGYLWSEAILSQRLPGIERALTTAGMALIFPILGGFLFYGLRIPLFESAWIALLVVLTLLGVVAVAITAPARGARRPASAAEKPAAAAVGVGSNALLHLRHCRGDRPWLRGVFRQERRDAEVSGFHPALVCPDRARHAVVPGRLGEPSRPTRRLTRASRRKHTFVVTNHEGVPEQYELKLFKKGKLATTWPITLNDGQTWQMTIAYTLNYSMVAELYLMPNNSNDDRL